MQVVTALMMERGDPILCEEFSYFYMLDSVITAAGYKVLPVAMDEHGMKPEHLNQVRWWLWQLWYNRLQVVSIFRTWIWFGHQDDPVVQQSCPCCSWGFGALSSQQVMLLLSSQAWLSDPAGAARHLPDTKFIASLMPEVANRP